MSLALRDHIVISHFSLNKHSIPQTFSVLKASNVFAKGAVFSIPSAQESLWHIVQISSYKDTIVQWFWKKRS